MASTYSSNLKIELIATGEQAGLWGATTNNNFTNVFEQAIVGRGTANFPADADLTLTFTDSVSSQTARNVYLNATSGVSLTQTRNLIVPTINKNYVVQNNTTGSQSIVVKTSAGTGITIPNGFSCAVYVDGTNVIQASNYFPVVTATQVNITGQGDLRLEDTSGGQYVALQAPSTVASSYTLTMPVDDGTNGQALITDGNGNLSWSTAASGDVYGPASATDNAVVRFDSTTGKLIKNSGVIIDNSNNVTGVADFTNTGNTTLGNASGDTLTITGTAVTTPNGLNFDSDTLVIDAANNRVGIGTASPSTTLTVQGTFVVGNGVSGSINYASTGALTIGSTAAEPLVFRTNAIERMRLDSSGNLGLGVTPSAWSSSFYKAIEGGDANSQGAIAFNLSGASNGVDLWSNGYFDGTNSIYKYSATAGLYQVAGNVHRWYNAPSGTAGNTITFTQAMTLDASGNLMLGMTTNTYGKFSVSNGTNQLAAGFTGNTPIISAVNNAGNAYVDLITDASTQQFRTGGNERMRIDSSGNVGIGLTNPAQKLDVDGVVKFQASSSGRYFQFVNDSSASYLDTSHALNLRVNGASSLTTAVTINTVGDVGIGTTSISRRLTVSGKAQFTSTTASNEIYLADSSTSIIDNQFIGSIGNDIRLGTGGLERMRIDSSGNVGIGTSTPSSSSGKLVVSGAANVYGDERKILNLIDTTALATGVGAGISFWGVSESGGGASQFGSIKGVKENATAANYAGALAFVTSNSSNVQTERMRITSDGKIGIGISSPGRDVSISSGSTITTLQVTNSTSGTASGDGFYVQQNGVNTFIVNQETGAINFGTDNTTRATITSGGVVLIGKTADDNTTQGVRIDGAVGFGGFVRSGGAPLLVNRLTNDGTLVEFSQDSVVEGTISVSGNTVSYNGGHLSRWSQLPNNQKDDSIVKGTVMSNLDDMCVWTKDGKVLPNEQLNKMKVSDVEGDTNVAGVFVDWQYDEQCQSDDMNVAMTGDMIIRIAEGVVVQKGDLLMSAGDGTAKPQGDDIRRSKTVAKVTSNHVTCTYADGSYCVPCVLMAC